MTATSTCFTSGPLTRRPRSSRRHPLHPAGVPRRRQRRRRDLRAPAGGRPLGAPVRLDAAVARRRQGRRRRARGRGALRHPRQRRGRPLARHQAGALRGGQGARGGPRPAQPRRHQRQRTAPAGPLRRARGPDRRAPGGPGADRARAAATTTTSLLNAIRVVKRLGVRVSVLPRLFEAVGSAYEFDEVEGATLLGVRRHGLSRSSWMIKRSFDLASALCSSWSCSPR